MEHPLFISAVFPVLWGIAALLLHKSLTLWERQIPWLALELVHCTLIELVANVVSWQRDNSTYACSTLLLHLVAQEVIETVTFEHALEDFLFEEKLRHTSLTLCTYLRRSEIFLVGSNYLSILSESSLVGC